MQILLKRPIIYMCYKIASKVKRPIFALLSMVGTILAQQARTQAQAVRQDDAQLTAAILSQQYCDNHPGTRSLFLKVKLELVNKGASPLDVGVPLSGVTIVSRSLSDAARGKHEAEMHGPEKILPEPVTEHTLPQRGQRQLDPGQRLESIHDVQVFVNAATGPSDIPSLMPGKHYLQIEVGAFPPGTRLEDMISSVRRITSGPVPFFVEGNPKGVPKCSNLFKQGDEPKGKERP